MKTEDCSNSKNNNSQPEGNEKLMGRREALNKVTLTALSTATMMMLLKSQPAMAASGGRPASNITAAPPEGQTQTWQRTKR